MTEPLRLNDLYHPVQPTISLSGPEVEYHECRPDRRLQPLIHCYWELRTRKELGQAFTYQIVADGCIDIFFEPESPGESFVMGFCPRYASFPLGRSFRYLGIRFLPLAFPRLFGVNADLLTNRVEDLQALVPSLYNFLRREIYPEMDLVQIVNLLDRQLLPVLSRLSSPVDPRLSEAVDRILRQKGELLVETNLDTGISPRQLRRLFNQYIGGSPKAFSNVIRFQGLLRTALSSRRLRTEKPYFDAGYFDQSHFIRQFRNYSGLTPGQAFPR